MGEMNQSRENSLRGIHSDMYGLDQSESSPLMFAVQRIVPPQGQLRLSLRKRRAKRRERMTQTEGLEMTTNSTTMTKEPSYLSLLRSGVLEQRVRAANEHLRRCDLCARYCHVDRLTNTEGAVCQIGEQALVYNFGTHHGEEDPISGWAGSGAIFFSRCNLHCIFCQNWEISQTDTGRYLDSAGLASMMLSLQERGCHNINLVSPSHVVAQIIAAVLIAAEGGLHLPLVYNTGGYDSLEALRLLDGIIDIYMPDMKYGAAGMARRLSGAPDYCVVNRTAVREMYRQVGDLVVDTDGLAVRGLLVHHLVLPGDLADSRDVLSFIAGEISPHTYVNLMDQYYPCYRADDYPPLDRPLLRGEYQRVLETAERHGLRRLDQHRERRRLGI
jgi:putative pyruvate formate lyase activating enzyme